LDVAIYRIDDIKSELVDLADSGTPEEAVALVKKAKSLRVRPRSLFLKT